MAQQQPVCWNAEPEKMDQGIVLTATREMDGPAYENGMEWGQKGLFGRSRTIQGKGIVHFGRP